MKTVILFRHGKSDWKADFDSDHSRPLAKRGRKAAKKMGRYLTSLGIRPDYVISSSAVRARKTARIAEKAGKWGCPVEVTDALYDAGPDDVLSIMQSAPPDRQVLVLVGHEPTWSESASRLMAGGRVAMPTAAMACITLPVEHWTDVQFGSGQLDWLQVPRAIPE